MFYPEAWFGMKSKPSLEIKQDCQQRGKRGPCKMPCKKPCKNAM